MAGRQETLDAIAAMLAANTACLAALATAKAALLTVSTGPNAGPVNLILLIEKSLAQLERDSAVLIESTNSAEA